MNISLARRAAALLTALAATAFVYGGVGVVSSAVGVAPAASAQAEGQGGPGGGQRGRMGKLLMSLGLSDAQKQQIRDIMKRAHEQNKDVTDPQQRRANFMASMQKVRDVLTPAQRAKWDAHIEAYRKSHPGMGQGAH